MPTSANRKGYLKDEKTGDIKAPMMFQGSIPPTVEEAKFKRSRVTRPCNDANC